MLKAINWLDKNVVSWIPIANKFNKPKSNSCCVKRVTPEYYDKYASSFPMDQNVEELTEFNLSNWYEFEKAVGTFEVGHTAGKSVLGVTKRYGYEKTTYGELAEKLGVNVMTLVYHLTFEMEEMGSAKPEPK
jgi:hypothetical protein